MTTKTHKILIASLVIAAIVGVVFLILMPTTVGERVKRTTAKVFDYEYIPNQNVTIDSREASMAADSIYKDFRKKYRFHYQTIGLATFADSSRMILLSDLPPHFECDSIATIFSKYTHKTELRKHPIGYDGFTTDMVILLGNATQDNCDRLIQRVNRELFLSDYKPTVMTLPANEKRQYFTSENIDYQITLEEFNNWFMEDGEGFIHLDDTATVLTITDIFAKQTHGIYFSQQPGFVAWSLAKNNDIAPHISEIRQFALDADLILGALADSNTLVIIGRERQASLNELPPLQVETILLLAATTEKELSQSLDVNDLMAGKMVNGRDWCPTYLSRELENTEFGDLMTITDILLKDWSEHGTIQESHYRYPKPGYYPFDRPLFRKLGLNELVYNWNTAGAMYAIDREGYTIYTLGRTGSLPVSYFNSQERSQSIGYRYESQAYHYFATLGNTDLARVVQYTALYQLFIDNDIKYSGNTYNSFPKNKPFLLLKPTIQFLDTIRHLNQEQITVLTDSLAQRCFRDYQKERVDKQLHDNEQQHNMTYTDENIDHIYHDVHTNTQAGLSRSFHEVRNLLSSLSEEQYKRLARYLSYPRGVSLSGKNGYTLYMQARRINQLMREIGKNNLDLLGINLANVKNQYAASLSGNSGRYMKTSSLIVTFNDFLTTGGHNLSSRISRVNTMTNYKRSRGNYTPSNYDKPTTDEPVTTKTSPSAAKPTGSKPTAKRTTKQANATPKANTHTPTTKSPSVRSRSSVISSAPRAKRGL